MRYKKDKEIQYNEVYCSIQTKWVINERGKRVKLYSETETSGGGRAKTENIKNKTDGKGRERESDHIDRQTNTSENVEMRQVSRKKKRKSLKDK